MLFSKIIKYIKVLSLEDFLRKLYYYSSLRFRTFLENARGLVKGPYLKRYDSKIGKGVLFRGLSNNIKVGRDLRIYDKTILEFGSESEFRIGESCVLSYGVLIACNKSIIIGDHVQVGEYTSIRDTTHSYSDTSIPMKLQKDISTGITIGNNVWIGRGCIIMPGTTIGDGVVIGSNSVVKGHLTSYGVYAGAPARLIKNRL
jgi:acetyltransferase-like isoleucine patch superfamily enzyme